MAGVKAKLIRRRLILAPDLRVARLLSLSSPDPQRTSRFVRCTAPTGTSVASGTTR